MSLYPEEFTTITVDLTLDGNSIVLVPHDIIASAMLHRVIDNAPGSFKLKSGGMATDDGEVVGAYLNFGGDRYMRRRDNGRSPDYAGAIKVRLDLTHVDAAAVHKLRGFLWYGAAVDPTATVDNFRLIPDGVCKTCAKPLVNFSEMEWHVCDDCAATCEHIYRHMVGHYDGNIAWMPCCDLCGRLDPNFVPSANPMEDVINTVAEGPLNALVLEHPDGTTTTITKKQV